MSFRRRVNNFVFHCVKHAVFRTKASVFGGNFTPLLFQKKSAAEARSILVETYGDHALTEKKKKTCRVWFRRFKSDNFNVEHK